MAAVTKGKKLPTGIRQRKNGSFEVRVSRNGKSYSVYSKTITEAKKAKAELEYRLDNGEIIENKKLTYGEWYKQWIANYKQNTVKGSTLNTYHTYYKSCIGQEFGDRKLCEIRGVDIQSFYNKLVSKGYKDSSLKLVKAIINSSFKQAYKDEIIKRNPVETTTLPKNKEAARKKRTALTKEQQALFMEYAKDSFLYNYFAISLRTGMRTGEMRGLKFSDIDRKNGVIHVQRTIAYLPNKGYVENTPKTKTSLRDIPLTPDLISLLEDQKNLWGFKIEKIDRFIFCDANGEILKNNRVQYEINRTIGLIHKAGYEFPRITSHVFRHTFATRAIESGMQPQVLKTIMGHSSLAMTMDLYSHVMEDTKAEEMQKIASAF